MGGGYTDVQKDKQKDREKFVGKGSEREGGRGERGKGGREREGGLPNNLNIDKVGQA